MELDVRQPVLLRPGEGETVTEKHQRTVLILADHELLDVTWSRYESGERGPDPHIHKRHADAFSVLEGELVFDLGAAAHRVHAPAGTLVLVPAGVIHSFRNECPDEARFLNIHAPSMGFVESMRVRRDGGDYDGARFDTHDPPEDGGRPVVDVVIRGPGAGDSIAVGASSVIFKAEGGDGEGTFSMTELTLAPGFPGPVPHRHETLVDSFYVLEGMLTLRIGDRTVEAPAGSYAFVPPGNVHTFSNPGGETVRALNLMAPGDFEQYLKEAARAMGGGPPDPAVMAEIASRYDFHPVE